ncbi:hypothetical protein Tco_1088046 [Tanacetum coccineum]
MYLNLFHTQSLKQRLLLLGKKVEAILKSAWTEKDQIDNFLKERRSNLGVSLKNIDDKAKEYTAFKEAKNKTGEVEKVYAMMADYHADNGGTDATKRKEIMGQLKFEATLARFEKWKESSQELEKMINSSMLGRCMQFPPIHHRTYMPTPYKSDIEETQNCDFYNCVESVPCKSKAASVPVGSRNSPASDNAGCDLILAKPVFVSAGWLNPAARPYFRPSSGDPVQIMTIGSMEALSNLEVEINIKILSQAEAEIRNQGVSADRDPAGIASAGSDPAGGNPAGSSQPAGSDEPAGKQSCC